MERKAPSISLDPRALLAQIAERAPDGFAVEYLPRGPGAWRLRLVRTVA